MAVPVFRPASGKLTAPALERAQHREAQTGSDLIALLSRLGLVPEQTLAVELAAYYRRTLISARDFPDQPLFPGLINRQFLKLHHVLPLAEKDGRLIVAIAEALSR